MSSFGATVLLHRDGRGRVASLFRKSTLQPWVTTTNPNPSLRRPVSSHRLISVIISKDATRHSSRFESPSFGCLAADGTSSVEHLPSIIRNRCSTWMLIRHGEALPRSDRSIVGPQSVARSQSLGGLPVPVGVALGSIKRLTNGRSHWLRATRVGQLSLGCPRFHSVHCVKATCTPAALRYIYGRDGV